MASWAAHSVSVERGVEAARYSPMQSGFATRAGGALLRTPSPRQQARRRRLMVICAMAALAIASGVIGSLAAPFRTAPTATLTYFPAQ